LENPTGTCNFEERVRVIWRIKATGETVESYTILTTDPNELIARMRLSRPDAGHPEPG
jgi:hypothetical protein